MAVPATPTSLSPSRLGFQLELSLLRGWRGGPASGERKTALLWMGVHKSGGPREKSTQLFPWESFLGYQMRSGCSITWSCY